LNLLSDTLLIRQTKYISQSDSFTGLSLVNLSNAGRNFEHNSHNRCRIVKEDDNGTTDKSDDLVNPVTVQLAPNTQESVDVAQLFSLDTADTTNVGRLQIESDQPAMVGFSAFREDQQQFLRYVFAQYGRHPAVFGLSRITS